MTTEEKIAMYCEKKEEEKALGKEIKSLGTAIKDFLFDTTDKIKQVGSWKVQLQHKVTETVDEVKLLAVLKEFWAEKNGSMQCPYVKTIEVVDMEALESALYKDEIPQDVLMKIDGCRVKKETDALVYSKVKGEE